MTLRRQLLQVVYENNYRLVLYSFHQEGEVKLGFIFIFVILANEVITNLHITKTTLPNLN